MYAKIITFLTACALAPQVFAGVFITSPVAGSTGQGGQRMTITWKDDGSPPSLADIGPCEFGVFSGNMQQQTEIQPINPSVDVSKQTTLDFNVSAAIGPNSDQYFIRVTSLGLKDPKNQQFFYEAFSAKFTLSNMSGQFSPVVQAQNSGITSASVAGPTPAPASPATPAVNTANLKVTTTSESAAKSTSSASTSSAPKTSPSNAAPMTRSNVGVCSVVGVITALLGSLL